MTDLRERLARALTTMLWDERAHSGPMPIQFENLSDSSLAILYQGADAVIAFLAAEPVSDDVLEVFMAVEDEESERMSDDMPLDDARRWLRRAGLQAGIRAWLGSPDGSPEGVK